MILPKGTKVVPHTKTIWSTLEKSVTWKTAKSRNQPYLYVTEYEAASFHNDCQEAYLLAEDCTASGDYFRPSDFITYEEWLENKVKELERMLQDHEGEPLAERRIAIKDARELIHTLKQPYSPHYVLKGKAGTSIASLILAKLK
jgi:hypothetical protein